MVTWRLLCRDELTPAGLALLEAGASVAPRDAAGRTALHAAADSGAGQLAAALLAQGADGEAADASGDTPMMLATRGALTLSDSLLHIFQQSLWARERMRVPLTPSRDTP